MQQAFRGKFAVWQKLGVWNDRKGVFSPLKAITLARSYVRTTGAPLGGR